MIYIFNKYTTNVQWIALLFYKSKCLRLNSPAARITPHVVMETTEAELQRSVRQQLLELGIPNTPLSYSLHLLTQPRLTTFPATVFCNDDQIFQISKS